MTVYQTLRALAVNVIAIYSRARRNRRKPDSMTTVDPCVERLYSLDELMELPRYCAMRGHFLRETNAISTCMSLSPFVRCSKMRNGCGLTRAKGLAFASRRRITTVNILTQCPKPLS
jgi:hypothetical protein